MKSGRYKERRVLDDEQYDAKLESIIEANFYPEMRRMRQQSRLIDAVERGDHAGAAHIAQQHPGLTPSRGVADGATPLHPSAAAAPCETPRDLSHVQHPAPPVVLAASASAAAAGRSRPPSLDAFFARNVAEEDVSYDLIREDDSEEHRRRNPWCYPGGEGAGNGGQLRLEAGPAESGGAAVLKIADRQGTSSSSSAASSLAATAAAGGGVAPSSAQGGSGGIKRSASGSIVTTSQSGPRRARPPVMGPPKVVNLRGIRGAAPEADGGSFPPPPPPRRGASVSSAASSSATAHGMVATPVIVPGQGGDSPFVTWGEVGGTPLLLAADPDEPAGAGGGGGGGGSGAQPAGGGEERGGFYVQAPTKREEVAKKLTEQAMRRMRKPAGGGAAAAAASAAAPNTPLRAKLLAQAGLTPALGARTPGGGLTVPAALAAQATPGASAGIFSKATKVASLAAAAAAAASTRATPVGPAPTPKRRRLRGEPSCARPAAAASSHASGSSGVTDGLLDL
eukprot:Rhum_TRINITY_DN14717_c3_g1::Rhum_TRINITY_DN14717_c3_g1_i1::g.113849::m.113849/K13118/DGCR14; protein DGCR14